MADSNDYNIKSIREQFRKAGVFYTPPELAERMAKYLPNDVTEVYDPACGRGGLFQIFGDNVQKYGLYFPREFDCRYCHRHISVGVDDLKDRHSVFCCAKCERQYWRETTRHPTHLTNHDPGMYQWAEKGIIEL